MHALSRTLCWLLVVCVLVPSGAVAADSPDIDQLRAGQFQALNQKFGTLQADYERGSLDDVELRAAFRVFYDTSPSLAPAYQAWTTQFPRSYVAHLARGIYYKYLGTEERGTALARDTSQAKMDSMQDALTVAGKEFAASQSLTRKPLLTYLHWMDVSSNLAVEPAPRELLDKALAIDPGNVIVREKYMGTLRPQWGGSLEQMQAFLEESRKAGLSAQDLQLLVNVQKQGEAWYARQVQNDPGRAASLYTEASGGGKDAHCLTCAGQALLAAGRFEEALASYEQALVQKPNDPSALLGRGWANFRLKNMTAAFRDIERAAKSGYAPAQHGLAQGYLMGTFAPLDRDKAIEWLEKAADQRYKPSEQLLPLARDRTKAFLPEPQRF